ncbi:MAG: ABC transporter ATP-binding protein [Clostridiales bacterium]|nr:ABC transporter ATP-binding protein [Clostridiales bacterium]
MIRLENIYKCFADKDVLSNVSMIIEKDKVNIINGPSGCGKTTLLNLISGIDTEYTGTITGIPKHISYLFQEDRLLPYFNTLDNVMFTLPESLDKEHKLKLAKKYLDALGLSNEYKTYPRKLSGGMARRVAIARSLAHPAQLLLLDEPFNGLNIELKHIVMDLILSGLNQMDQTIILVSHDQIILDYIKNKNIIDINI